MKRNAEYVYESLFGEAIYPREGVENAFAENSLCDTLYSEAYGAAQRICERLGVADDPDMETVFRCFSEIQRELCMKMYAYGAEFENTAR